MGLTDTLKKFVTGEGKEESKSEQTVSGPVCSFCNKPGADKKFGGSFWHKKCLRNTRKFAKRMI